MLLNCLRACNSSKAIRIAFESTLSSYLIGIILTTTGNYYTLQPEILQWNKRGRSQFRLYRLNATAPIDCNDLITAEN